MDTLNIKKNSAINADNKNVPERKVNPALDGGTPIIPAGMSITSSATPRKDSGGFKSGVNIRTMKSDIDTLLKTTKPSLINMLSREAEKETSPRIGPKLADYKNVIIIGAVSLFLVSAGLASFWIFSSRTPAEEAPQKLVPSSPLFAVESSRTIEVKTLDRVQFINLMADSFREFERAGTVKRIIVKVADGPQERFATVSDFFNFYRITVPQNVLTELSGEPMFFFYYGGSGARFGMAVRVKNEDRALRAALFWEDTMRPDLYPLLFANKSVQENAVFEDRTYKNIDWRFVKLFPEEDIGISYTVFPAETVFVLTTGKESMEAVIGRLFDAR